MSFGSPSCRVAGSCVHRCYRLIDLSIPPCINLLTTLRVRRPHCKIDLMIAPPKPLEMMTRLIEIPSISSVKPERDMGNRPAIDLLAEWLDGLGYAITIQQIGADPTKANLIATLGQGDDGLVLAGHTDTVPFDEGRWRFDPFRLTECNGRLYGLGTSDMKCFLAIAIEAARQFTSRDLKRPLTILATADEESSMCGAKQLRYYGRRLGRYCVIGEPTNLKPVRQHKGIFMEAIILRGRSGHSSDPRLGNSALEGMRAVIEALIAYREELAAHFQNSSFEVPFPTLNLGHICGGDSPNRICGECELHIDLRSLPGMDNDELRHTLHQRVGEVAQRLGLECEFQALFEGTPAMETPADSAIIQFAEQLTGHKSGVVAFGTEGPYLNAMGTDTVILGPGDIAQAHQPDEYLAVDRIQPTIDLLRALIKKICL
jgi:acetylornithine deacetylase